MHVRKLLKTKLNEPIIILLFAVHVARPHSRGNLTALFVHFSESPFWSWFLRSWTRRALRTAASPPLWLTSWPAPSRKVAALCWRSPPAPFPAMRYEQWGRPALWLQPLRLHCAVFGIPWWKCPSLGPVALEYEPACLLRFPFRSCRRRWLWSVCWMSCVKWPRTSGSLCSCRTTPTFSRPPWVSGDTLGVDNHTFPLKCHDCWIILRLCL